MFGLTFHKGYYVFSFYPDYNYVFILIIIVLFLQTWTTIRLTIKKSLKYLIMSGGIISIFAFGLSNVHPVNHWKLNEGFIKGCAICRYDLQLPQTDNYIRLFNGGLIENIYIVLNSDNETVIVADNKTIELDNLSDKIKWYQNQRDISEIPLMVYRLHIDKRVKMDFVSKIKTEFSNCNVTRIAYAVIPTKLKYDKKYYHDFSFNSYIHRGYRTEIGQDNTIPLIPPFELKDEINKHETIFVKFLSNESFKCNDTIVSGKDFETYISSFILTNINYLIAIEIENSQSFNDYFAVLSKCKNVIFEMRENYSYQRFNKTFDELYPEQQNVIKRKYPMGITELTETMSEQLKIE